MQIYQQSSGKIQNSTHSMAEPHKLWLVALLKIFLQLLSCFFFTRAHLQPHRLQPTALPQLSFPLHPLGFMPRSKQQMHADSYSLYFQYLVGFFSSFKAASYNFMWTTAVQHYQVFLLSLYFGLGQVVVLHIADNNNKSLQSPEICSNQKKQTLQYILL